MSGPYRPFDLGFQPERTLLAWRRTAAALAVVSLTGARVLVDVLEGGAVLAGGSGLVAAAAFALVGERRYRRFTAAAARGEVLPRPGGVAFALALVFTVACGLLGGVVVVALRLGALSLN